MNGRDEELLSAYYDGELPDDEKSRAEQLLADDLSARELLDDVADVSGWIRALPRPIAPADMQQAVMARLQIATAPQASSRRAAARGPNWRRRATWATVSVAGLLCAFVLQRAWRVPDPSVGGDAAVAVADRATETVAHIEAPVVAGAAITMPMGQSEPVAIDTMQLAMSKSIDLQQRLAGALERGEAPVVGEERADLAEVGDRVVVIRYRIVDSLQLPGKVQLVLTEKGINEVNVNGNGGWPAVEAEQLGTSAGRQLAAFYVEAPESDFQSAVATLTTLDGVTDVTTNFVATTTAPTNADMTIVGAGQGGEAANRPGQSAEAGREGLVRDAPGSGEAVEHLPSRAPASAKPAAAAAQLADDSAPQDQPSTLGLDVAEAAPAASLQFAAPVAKGYQVAVPAEKELIEELQNQEGETSRRADGVKNQESKLAASAPPTSGAPTQQWNYFYGQRHYNRTPPPASDRVRAVIVLVPEPAE